ncbi:MAG: 30S ribosomal protein S3 [Nanoarchaeota archaeon]|nr:30S ribosomal protein S3 [Nanoarchaeota archaeon]
MIGKQFIGAKKKEFIIKEFIKKELGKGKISKIGVERTPLGERIIVHTTKPGLIIGRRGLAIQDLTALLKEKFKLENPQIEIVEIIKAEHDAQFMADNIASALERFGQLRFKSIAYRALQRIMESGAYGAEIRLNGKLPSDRAKGWRFAYGYLKKTGASADEIVDKAYSSANTKPGVVGIKVFIVPPTSDIREIKDREIVEEVIEIKAKEIKTKKEKDKEKPEEKKKEEEKIEKTPKKIKKEKENKG